MQAIYLSEGGGEWMVRGASGCLGAGVRLRVGPELLVLLPAKALVVVAFAADSGVCSRTPLCSTM